MIKGGCGIILLCYDFFSFYSAHCYQPDACYACYNYCGNGWEIIDGDEIFIDGDEIFIDEDEIIDGDEIFIDVEDEIFID